MGGVGINLFNWLSQGCMVLSLIKRYLLKLLCQGRGWRRVVASKFGEEWGGG